MSLLFPDTAFVLEGCQFILRGEDSAESLLNKLRPFLMAANREALYILGKLVLYSEGDRHTGYVICINGCPIIWSSKLQDGVALSTMMAEYYALSTCM